ncbi:pyrroline-5-carboxylate reductase [Novosphingobium huizhouense]|uniref:pyrroline-5-carboxylate reductase n=1 Tax=Novosphingobium huizhouense TaxID=2866625 RepID=UPI001CD8C4F4|nr:pyrroline-5-carboxylate reductase [Novosphingobium huizhouense]
MRILQFGCGNMGGAMLAGWLAGGLAASDFTVVDPFLDAAPDGVRLLRAAPDGEAPAEVVLIGFKPQQFAASAAAVAPHVGEGTLLLSILAGVDLETLRAAFPAAGAIVRVMPNLAVALGKSPIALVGDADGAARDRTDRLMAPLGQAEWLSGEDQMDLVTALAGSGPAFVYRFIDALAQGATDLGLPREQADRLALAMVEGAALLAAQSPHAPGELARRVASPGGTTQKGIDVLDAEGRLVALMTDTLRAARDRSAEMTREARKS